ncbi:RagB/SusD family nutrient uptake outer membrane protein [Algoriphagus sp.]|uniref:RagB/SusD family nutrient uptake outer membrane protein n=1 Tax=Algoriphagus sp. TaxID=1872435 RepID=UPI003F720743
MEKLVRLITGLIFLALISSCEGFLDPKPDQSLVVPNNIEDVRALLDNINVFNRQPVLSSLSSDEFQATDAGFNALNEIEQHTYSWSEDPYPVFSVDDWTITYSQVFYANVALESLKGLDPADVEYGKLKGEALFHRSHAYYHLLQQFAPAYNKNGGNENQLGIVLKESPDINEPAIRATLEESYDRVISDLEEAVNQLPDNQLPKTRPTKAIALGLLGRIYLNTFDFEKATAVAERALGIYSDRLDFNSFDVNAANPFANFGPEVLFFSEVLSYGFQFSREVNLDTILLKTYEEGDLRLPAYFDLVEGNRYYFAGKLTGNALVFGGLSVGELELIAAEGNARIGNEDKARFWLNALLSRRIDSEYFVPVEISGNGLLEKILEERKKELVGRGIRWTDLRRLNQEPEFQSSLSRTINGSVVTLDPNSNRYVFLIPDAEIQLTGIEQNR